MKKEKQVKSYTRRTKSGKTVTVRAHSARYDAAEDKKKGSGKELEDKKSKIGTHSLSFTPEEYEEWYHWDIEGDPKNKSALKVERDLKERMGSKVYNMYFKNMKNMRSPKGHIKAFKNLSATLLKKSKTTTPYSGAITKDSNGKSFKEHLQNLISGLTGSSIRTYKKPAKVVSRSDGSFYINAYDYKIEKRLTDNGWKCVDKITVIGGSSNYVSKDGKYKAVVNRNGTIVIPTKEGEQVKGHSWDSALRALSGSSDIAYD